MPLSRIQSASISDGAVATVDLANGAVTDTKLATGSVENYFGTQGFALGARNRIINGDMRIDQRNNGSAVTNVTETGYFLDRWQYFQSSSGSVDIQRSTDAPSGFNNSLQLTVNTTNSPSLNQANGFVHRIEGYNISDLGLGTAAAKPITLSFWVKSSVVGIYVLNLTSSSVGDASYSTTYTINAANTWEFKTIVIPGDVANTWANLTNGQGMALVWGLGGGPGRYPTVLNAWTTELRFISATSTSTQWISNAGATFYITGVQLEAGSVATPFERRPFGTELALCQRYFQTVASAFGKSNATETFFSVAHKSTMRASPTFSTSGTIQITDRIAIGLNSSSPSPVVITANPSYGEYQITISGVSSGSTWYLVGGLFLLSAEL
jgi:hypothetical protein